MTTNKLTDIKQFTKKPVTISAIQWTGDNLPAVIEFTGKHPRWSDWFADMDEYVAHVRGDGNRFKIFTLEGVMDALPGDWIIRGIHGEHYPCKPDIFSATYEPAELQERRKADSSEPIGWTDAEELRSVERDGCGYLFKANPITPHADPLRVIKLYAVPPAPVSVPDELTREEYRRRFMMEDNFDDTYRGGWNACRAAMLQGAEPVTTAYKLPELRYLDTVKFNADCALQGPESIYAQEFFMSLDEVFGERGNYTDPVQAKAVSILIAEIFRLRGYPVAPLQEAKP